MLGIMQQCSLCQQVRTLLCGILMAVPRSHCRCRACQHLWRFTLPTLHERSVIEGVLALTVQAGLCRSCRIRLFTVTCASIRPSLLARCTQISLAIDLVHLDVLQSLVDIA